MVYEMLKDRSLRSIEEWEVLLEAFDGYDFPTSELYLIDQPDYEVLSRIYKKCGREDVRQVVEKMTMREWERNRDDKKLASLVKLIGKINPEFKKRFSVPLAERMLSKKGAKLAWGISALLLVAVVLLSIILVNVKSSPAQSVPEVVDIVEEYDRPVVNPSDELDEVSLDSLKNN